MKQLAILFLLCLTTPELVAQNSDQPSPIIFIYDASGSMWGQIDGKSKMEIALEVLSDAVNKLPDNQKIGLVAYGHRSKGDCKDVETLVDVETGSKSEVVNSLKAIKPLGKTPLAYSAKIVIDKLRQTKLKATIILVTDGIESCDGSICDFIKSAKKDGIDFRLHIVGFGLKDETTDELECAAKEGGGQYYDAADKGGLSEVMNEVTSITVDEPAKNFSVYVIKNGKPIDAYVKVYRKGESKSHRSVRTYADTAYLFLETGFYDFEAKPLENSDVKAIVFPNIESSSEKISHRTFSFDGAKFNVSIFNNKEGWDAMVNVYKTGEKKSVSSTRTYGTEKVMEVNPGVYDIVIQALVIDGLEIKHTIPNVELAAGETKEIKHTFESGILIIGAKSAQGLVDAIIKIKEVNTKKEVASRRTYTSSSSNPKKFILNPGKYEITLKGLAGYAGKTQTFIVDLKTGDTVEKVANF